MQRDYHDKIQRDYHKWHSRHLGREMELLVFGHGGARVLVFPTRAGRFYDYENWGFVETLRHQLSQGWLQLFCVDSIDAESLYGFWRPPCERIQRHTLYEAYILDEVLPFSRRLNPSPHLIAHGCSLGAYHAVNIAFRHPQLFSKVVALSGRYDLTESVGSFAGLFDGYYDETIYFHTPSHFVPNLCDPHMIGLLRQLEIILVIGGEDAFIANNREFSHMLWQKGIWHALHIWDGEAHRARYWRPMAALYL